MRAAIYARPSLDYPLPVDRQIDQLKAVAAERGWDFVQEFTDRPNTVRKGVDCRPGQEALINAVRCGRVDVVCVSSICRLGKSLIDLATCLEACRAAQVGVWFDDQQIDTSTSSLSVFNVSELLALHLRQLRRGRILAGLASSRALGIRSGRPPLGRGRVQRAERELAAGKGVREVARIVGISPASASRLKTSLSQGASAP
jgi:DNA invertase Pin-like site-specific DNA recombinase